MIVSPLRLMSESRTCASNETEQGHEPTCTLGRLRSDVSPRYKRPCGNTSRDKERAPCSAQTRWVRLQAIPQTQPMEVREANVFKPVSASATPTVKARTMRD